MKEFTDKQKDVFSEFGFIHAISCIPIGIDEIPNNMLFITATLIDEIIRLRVTAPVRDEATELVRDDDVGRKFHEAVQNFIHPIKPESMIPIESTPLPEGAVRMPMTPAQQADRVLMDKMLARAHGLPEETEVSKEGLDWLVPKVGDHDKTFTITSVVDKLVELSNEVHERNKANDITNQSLTQNIGKQVNLLVKALELHSQHPTFPIHCLIDSEELVGDYQWTGHILSSVELGWWYEEKEGEQIWTEWDDIIDRIQCEGDEKDDFVELTAEQAGEIAKQRAHQVILIRTTAD